MEWTRKLVVSLKGVNFGFWSRLGCSGKLLLAVKVSLRVAREEITKQKEFWVKVSKETVVLRRWG